MINNGLFTSDRGDWETPPALFGEWNSRFHFDVDVCASAENAKCAFFYDKDADGLAQTWKGACWCNPPYGRGIVDWVRKAFREAMRGNATTVMLVPARTDTRWWHEWAMKADEIHFLKGRIKFVGGKSNAPFPSAILVFKNSINNEPPRGRGPL